MRVVIDIDFKQNLIIARGLNGEATLATFEVPLGNRNDIRDDIMLVAARAADALMAVDKAQRVDEEEHEDISLVDAVARRIYQYYSSTTRPWAPVGASMQQSFYQSGHTNPGSYSFQQSVSTRMRTDEFGDVYGTTITPAGRTVTGYNPPTSNLNLTVAPGAISFVNASNVVLPGK